MKTQIRLEELGYKKFILRLPMHELNSEPSFKFLSQFNGNKEIDMVFNSIFYV